MTVPIRRTPYLITSRDFPAETELKNVLTKSYSEISFAVNERTIGIYDKFMLVTGDRYLNNADPQKRRQGYRQVYEVTNISTTTAIEHGLNDLDFCVKIYGTAETSSKYIPLPYVSTTTTDMIQLDIDKSLGTIDITFGATSPTILKAYITLEFLLKDS